MKDLLKEIRNCTTCLPHLTQGVNPILTAHKNSKIAIIGQAPGSVVHRTSIPWNDKSGERLRKWLDVAEGDFYNPEKIALIPMGFCYPGKGKSGDLPPRKECAPQWHELLFKQMKQLELIVLIGMYAQSYYLKKERKKTLTETVSNYEAYLPTYFPLPHPSPRNNIWLKKNPWLEQEVIPVLQQQVKKLIK